MPFGLKVAPSLFQKAMTRFFEPILHHALIYIDDILLFSTDHETYMELLSTFHKIEDQYGIILSTKKTILEKQSVEFLGFDLKDEKYHLGPHIDQELLHFSDHNLSRKQLQQLLNIINYLRDFLPHVAVHTN